MCCHLRGSGRGVVPSPIQSPLVGRARIRRRRTDPHGRYRTRTGEASGVLGSPSYTGELHTEVQRHTRPISSRTRCASIPFLFIQRISHLFSSVRSVVELKSASVVIQGGHGI